MLYQDFDLLIDRSGENLRARVMDSSAGQATAEFRLPFSEVELENFQLRLGSPAGRQSARERESRAMKNAKIIGAGLFDAVFSGDVKACFERSFDNARRQDAGLRIRLRLVDPAVIDLPWEYLHDRTANRFLALSIHTPLVRYTDLAERIQPIPVALPIRALVMISSPTDFPALDVEAEWTRLNEAVEDLISRNQIAIQRLHNATLEALQRRLQRERYHIFHFVGHGAFDEDSKEGMLILEGNGRRGHRVSSQQLGMMLHDHEWVRLAILNEGGGMRTLRTDPFAGSAQSFMRQGIPAVIGMQFEIGDDVSSRFAYELYEGLAKGHPVDASMTEARKAIFGMGHEVEWAAPVVYTSAPDGRIFEVETTGVLQPGNPVDASAGDRAARELVNTARTIFAAGHRAQALEMLRGYDQSHEAVASALAELTTAQQRIDDEAMEKHLNAASELLASGDLAGAFGQADDATKLDPKNHSAIALKLEILRAIKERARAHHPVEHDSAPQASPGERRQIFLCYRREDTQDATGRLYDTLTRRFGAANVFMDLDNVPLGVNFPSYISQRLSGCAAVLVMIGRNWITMTDQQGNRRLDQPEDHVRIEVALALKQSIPVIPVLVQNAPMPRALDLPEEIQGLALQNGLTLAAEFWRAGVDKLLKGLAAILDE